MLHKAMMQIEFNKLGTKLDTANLTFNQYVNSYVRLEGGDDSRVKVTESSQIAARSFDRTGDIPQWGESTDTQTVGVKGEVYQLYNDNTFPDPRKAPPASNPGDAPKPSEKPLFDSEGIVSCSKVRIECLLPSELEKFDPDLKNDPETGKPYDEDAPDRRLLERTGNGRDFTVRTTSGSFVMRSPRYPAGHNGESLIEANPNAAHWGPAEPFDCEDDQVTDDYQGEDAEYVTEHIFELNYFPAFIQFAITGEADRQDGTPYHARSPTVPENALNPQSPFFQEYATWDPALGNQHPGSPVDRIWEIFGSVRNPDNLVNAQSQLNSIKGRIWQGDQPMADRLWNRNRWNRAGTRPQDIARAEAALSYIRQVLGVLNYMNDPTINTHLGGSLSDMLTELETYSDRYNAQHGTDIDLGSLHREYLHVIQVPRLNGVRAWLRRRVEQLTTLWDDQQQQTPTVGLVGDIVDAVEGLSVAVNNVRLDISRMPGAH